MMKELPEWAKWMARDKDGSLWMYDNKPEKFEEREGWYHPATLGEVGIFDDLSRLNFPHVKWSDGEPTEIITNTPKGRDEWYQEIVDTTINNTLKEVEFDPIEPDHYNKGEIDLYESAYRTRPFNETRAILEFVAERYMKRDKFNRLEDINKSIYTLKRLRDYEVLELEKNLPPIERGVKE